MLPPEHSESVGGPKLSLGAVCDSTKRASDASSSDGAPPSGLNHGSSSFQEQQSGGTGAGAIVSPVVTPAGLITSRVGTFKVGESAPIAPLDPSASQYRF